MSDSLRVLRVVLLASPLLLAGCDSIDIASIDMPKIDWPWATPDEQPAKTATAAREEPVQIPDGMQRDGQPFGEAP